MAKINYYNIANLLSTKAQYLMLLGQRANGKSYQCKETVLKDAFEKGRRFVYLRRWSADIKAKNVSRYFDDYPIKKLTKGLYTGIIAYGGVLYFSCVDEDGKLVKGPEIGYYCALNELERYKSQVFSETYNILYEEFITDKVYLDNEPSLLQQFVSTVFRHSEGRVFLIGNTLSRVCPYFVEWCLDGVLKQKLGTIEVYHYHVADSIINIAVEYCANSNAENKMFFGQTAKQIVSGEWDTKDVPKLPKPQSCYEKVYEVLVEYQSFKFVIELLVEPVYGGLVCFVYPFTGMRKIARVLTDTFTDTPLHSARLDTRRRPEALINECFRTNKVCYSDNLTGADFRHVNEAFHIGMMF